MTLPAGADVIREAARNARASRSARSVAREIGMSPAGLRHFLRGGRPYHHTMEKLRRWHALHLARGAECEPPAVAKAIESLVSLLPPAARGAVLARVRDAVRTTCSEAGAPRPGEIVTRPATASDREDGAGPLATQAFRPAAPGDTVAVPAPLRLPAGSA